MQPLDEKAIRTSFVNASKGEVARMNLPADLDDRRWPDLDLLTWIDPRSPRSAYLVVPTPERGVVGIVLKRAGGGSTRARMCSLCTTTHGGQGVALMVAQRAGRSGREGNTVGVEMCASLACSAYARGTLERPAMTVVHETLSVDQRVERLRRNVLAFVDRVLAS
ncbi:FBP domain-containing protein [Nocardioides acrostichi]|uniref:FBP domain-containing protein n=1 Tax=Nocardioides acrostichi TaxID=2784339 RepID=A0A930YE50_9ACTN|nr:FBP domain-containing protein [Nocardioides acrostichi]MBF4163149.1 FBP domain-containing protein [Nocardioides acrostichi]